MHGWNMYEYMYTCMYTCIHVYMYMYMYMYMYLYIHKHKTMYMTYLTRCHVNIYRIHVCIHMCVYMYVYIYLCIYVCICICIYNMYIYIHMHIINADRAQNATSGWQTSSVPSWNEDVSSHWQTEGPHITQGMCPATHCNTLQHAATKLEFISPNERTPCNSWYAPCITLHHTAPHCNKF